MRALQGESAVEKVNKAIKNRHFIRIDLSKLKEPIKLTAQWQ